MPWSAAVPIGLVVDRGIGHRKGEVGFDKQPYVTGIGDDRPMLAIGRWYFELDLT